MKLKIRYGPDGINFFDRRTGGNLLLDEVRVPEDLWALAPRHVSIALTNNCDLTCPHCFAPKFASELDSRVIVAWLDELDANGCIGVGFGGGEPTLFKDLPEICNYATKNTGLALTLTTNAQLLDERLASRLKGNINFIRVSMDGVGATYEKLRGRSFTSLLERFDIIKGFTPFGINYLVNSETLPDLDSAITLADDLGASEFLLLPQQPIVGYEGIDKNTLESLRRWVSDYRGSIQLCVSEAGADGFRTCNPLAQEKGVRAYAHIDASGIIKRSSFDASGVVIDSGGVLEALKRLKQISEEKYYEDME